MTFSFSQGGQGTTWLIAGPPGCGKTTWICNKLRSHQGSCGYLRLEVPSQHGMEQGRDHCIDGAWSRDQIPELQDLSDQTDKAAGAVSHALNLIEVQQFQAQRDRHRCGNGLDDLQPCP